MRLKTLACAVAAAVILTTFPATAHQDAVLKVRDPVHEVAVDVGGSLSVKGEVTNTDSHDVVLDISFVDYNPKLNGTYEFLGGEPNKVYGLSEFMSAGLPINIPAGQTREYEVLVSATAEFGQMSRYGLIHFSDVSQGISTSVPLVASVGSPDYSMSVSDVQTFNSTASNPHEVTSSFDVEIMNEGIFAIKPEVTVQVHDESKQLLGTAVQIIPGQIVLPGASRVFRLDMDQNMQKGVIYTASASAKLPDGSTSKLDSVEVTVALPAATGESVSSRSATQKLWLLIGATAFISILMIAILRKA